MISLMFGLIFAIVTICLAAVYGVFEHVKARELKRRARGGDKIAAALYRVVAFGLSSKTFLVILMLTTGYVALVLLTLAIGIWYTGFLVVVFGIAGVIFVHANGGAHRSSVWLAAKIAPAIGWIVERLNPLFEFLARFSRRLAPLHFHTGVYEKEDLAELLEQQKTQHDNRINLHEIELLQHALRFGDKTVAETLVPKRVVKTVSAEDSIGPVLMGELHETGYSRFPVYDGKRDNIVGILYLHDLVEKKRTGKVSESMRSPVRYAHENFSLFETLQAFLKTRQHLFIVVNDFEEYVGVITIEDVLEQMIGKHIVDEFDQYEDPRAVAAKAAHQEHEAHLKHEVNSEATPEKSEVVE